MNQHSRWLIWIVHTGSVVITDDQMSGVTCVCLLACAYEAWKLTNASSSVPTVAWSHEGTSASASPATSTAQVRVPADDNAARLLLRYFLLQVSVAEKTRLSCPCWCDGFARSNCFWVNNGKKTLPVDQISLSLELKQKLIPVTTLLQSWSTQNKLCSLFRSLIRKLHVHLSVKAYLQSITTLQHYLPLLKAPSNHSLMCKTGVISYSVPVK